MKEEIEPVFYFIATLKCGADEVKQTESIAKWMKKVANSTKTCPVLIAGREMSKSNPHFHGIIATSPSQARRFRDRVKLKTLKGSWKRISGGIMLKLEPYQRGFGTVAYCLDKHEPYVDSFCNKSGPCLRIGCWHQHVNWMDRQTWNF